MSTKYEVVFSIPVVQNDDTSFDDGHRYRDQLSNELERLGGIWDSSGFGGGCELGTRNQARDRCIIQFQAFDVEVLFPDAESANRGAKYARNWLKQHGYTIGKSNKVKFDGQAYVYVNTYDPDEIETEIANFKMGILPERVPGKRTPIRPSDLGLKPIPKRNRRISEKR